MPRTPITRRDALGLLAALPFIARLPVRPLPPPQFRRVVLGRYHSLLIEPDGTLKAWSHGPTPNTAGELGLGHANPVEQFTLYPVPGLTNVVAAGAAWDISFAVLADGRTLAWGERSEMLGVTPLEYVEVYADSGPRTLVPTPVAARFDAVDIAVGGGHVLGLARDGTVWAWGDGRKGQLGVGDLPIIKFKTHDPSAMSFVPFPIPIPGLTGVVAISAGFDHCMALLKDGTIRAWGGNKNGHLGDGTTVDRRTPVLVPIRKAVAISASSGFSVALLEDGRVMAWGDSPAGSLGRLLPNQTSAPVPTLVPGVATGRAIATGNGHALVLTQAGTVISWGINQFGQLGHGRFTQQGLTAAPVTGLTGVHSVTAQASTSVAVLDDGRIMAWGAGPGSTEQSFTAAPLKLDGLVNR